MIRNALRRRSIRALAAFRRGLSRRGMEAARRAMAADPSLLGPWLAGVTSFAGDDGHAAVRDGLGL